MSALPPKAAVTEVRRDVRLVPKAGSRMAATNIVIRSPDVGFAFAMAMIQIAMLKKAALTTIAESVSTTTVQTLGRIVSEPSAPGPRVVGSCGASCSAQWYIVASFSGRNGRWQWRAIIPQLQLRHHQQALSCLGGSFSAMKLDGENLSAAGAPVS